MKIKVSKYVAKSMHREANQIIMQTYIDSGKGGQHRNKTQSGVRLIDTITGLRAEDCTQRNQLANKKLAKEKLVLRLIEYYQTEEAKSKETDLDKFGNQFEIVRNYDFKLGVVDRRVPGKTYSVDRVLSGKDLGKLIKDVHNNVAQNYL